MNPYELYEIDQRIADLVDPETGELMDYEAFAQLQMEREQKIEALALWIKNMTSTVSGIKSEMSSLADRKRQLESRCERLKEYLAQALNGEKFDSPRCVVTFRRSVSTQVQDEEALIRWLESNGYSDCVKYGTPTVSASEVKKLIKDGVPVPYVALSKNLNVGVK